MLALPGNRGRRCRVTGHSVLPGRRPQRPSSDLGWRWATPVGGGPEQNWAGGVRPQGNQGTYEAPAFDRLQVQ